MIKKGHFGIAASDSFLKTLLSNDWQHSILCSDQYDEVFRNYQQMAKILIGA
jgi:hypothetical protein